MDRFWVPVQGLLVAAVGALAVFATGHESGLSIAADLGLVISIAIGGWYFARTPDGGRAFWRTEARQGLIVGALGFGLPLAAGVVAWQSPHLPGWLLSSDAAAFAAVCLGVIPTAALTSSMVDRYLILLACLGSVARRSGAAHPLSTRRGAAVSRRCGSPIALSASSSPSPPSRSSWPSCWSRRATRFLATDAARSVRVARRRQHWVEGLGEYLDPVAGLAAEAEDGEANAALRPVRARRAWQLVIDVSVDPGVKVITGEGERTLVPLSLAARLNPGPRPEGKDNAWCRHHVLLHVLKLRDLSAGPGPL